jgi:hypothetical protein
LWCIVYWICYPNIGCACRDSSSFGVFCYTIRAVLRDFYMTLPLRKKRKALTSSRKCARVVDRVALEMRSTGNCTGGSNPSTSAQSIQWPPWGHFCFNQRRRELVRERCCLKQKWWREARPLYGLGHRPAGSRQESLHFRPKHTMAPLGPFLFQHPHGHSEWTRGICLLIE